MKRLITIFLIAANVLLSLGCTAFAAADGENPFVGDDNYIRYAALEKLDLIPEEFLQFQPNRKITKSEFSSLILTAFNLRDSGITETNSHFADVTVNTPYFKEISVLYTMGTVKGDENGFFYPNAEITYREACAIILKMLGYQPMVDSLGGFEQGVINAAGKIGLMSGVTAGDSEVEFSQAVRLVYNALTTDRMVLVGDGKYEVMEDSNVFEAYYSLRSESGIITANGMTALYSEQDAGDGYVVIDGVKYRDPDGEVSKLLGYNVDFLYKDDKSGKEIFMTVINGNNSVMSITDENLDSFDGSTLKYFDENGKTRSLKLDFNLSVIYNGKVDTQSVGFDWAPDEGDIQLLNNNGGSTYNIVFVNAYKNYTVKSADPENGVIRTRFGDSIEIGDDDSLYLRGRKITAADVKKDMTVSVAQSRNKTYKTVYVSDSVIKGTVTELTEDTMSIDGQEYKLSNDFKRNMLASITPGFSASFYVDYRGKVCSFLNQEHDGYQYGFCVGTDKNPSGFNRQRMKVFDLNGTFGIYELADDVTVFGRTVQNRADVLDCFDDETGSFSRQLIKFKTDSDDRVNAISFAVTAPTDDSRCLVMNHSRESRIWRPSARSFNGQIGMNENARVMLVPQDPAESENEKSYAVTSYSYFDNDEEYEAEAFDCNNADVPKVLVVYAGKKAIGTTTQVSLIESVRRALDDDGISAVRMACWKQNVRTEVFFADSVSVNGTSYSAASIASILGKGDCIRIGTDFSGRVDTVELLLDMSESDPTMGKPNPSNTDFTAKFRTIYGKVIERDGNNILIRNASGSATESHSVWYTGSRFTLCDMTKNGKISAVTSAYLDRILDSDDYMVLYQTESCLARNVIIYKMR